MKRQMMFIVMVIGRFTSILFYLNHGKIFTIFWEFI